MSNPEDKRPLRDKLAERGRADGGDAPRKDEPVPPAPDAKAPPADERPPSGLPGLDEIDFDAMDPEEAAMLQAVIAHIQGLESENAALRRENSRLRAGAEKTPEVVQLKEQVQRMQAEEANLRTRLQRQAKAETAREIKKFALDMLPLADNLDRAVEALSKGSKPRKGSKAASVIEGVETTRRLFQASLKKWGIEKMDVTGAEFDPKKHEAMMTVPTEDRKQHNTVAQVLEAGYEINGELLRAARVSVAQHPNPKADRRRALSL